MRLVRRKAAEVAVSLARAKVRWTAVGSSVGWAGLGLAGVTVVATVAVVTGAAAACAVASAVEWLGAMAHGPVQA